jgi:hypothetical protein
MEQPRPVNATGATWPSRVVEVLLDVRALERAPVARALIVIQHHLFVEVL